LLAWLSNLGVALGSGPNAAEPHFRRVEQGNVVIIRQFSAARQENSLGPEDVQDEEQVYEQKQERE
jgi:hypothetical protein